MNVDQIRINPVFHSSVQLSADLRGMRRRAGILSEMEQRSNPARRIAWSFRPQGLQRPFKIGTEGLLQLRKDMIKMCGRLGNDQVIISVKNLIRFIDGKPT